MSSPVKFSNLALERLGSQDRKDFEKFSKYFVYKCIQVIVQSRLGVKLHMQSKHLSSGSDWFNLSIRDHSDILVETKKVYDGIGCLYEERCVCVEISVRTVDGDSMLLESWWIDISDPCDPNTRISFAVYNRMGVLLKALLTVSRATPAYKLSRRQGPENYIICYRLYVGTPSLGRLGEGYRKQSVGRVPTPAGTVNLTVAYRTVLLISPQQHAKDILCNLQDDHYHHAAACLGRNNDADAERASSGKLAEDTDMSLTNSASNACQFIEGTSPHRIGAFATPLTTGLDDDGDDEESLPFENLLDCASKTNNPPTQGESQTSDEYGGAGIMKRSIQPMQVTTSGSGGSVSVPSSSSHSPTHPEANVLRELKTPFAGSEEDLNKFYRECAVAPPLSMFQQTSGIHDTLNSFTDQLAQFEADAKIFDAFVNSLQDLDMS